MPSAATLAKARSVGSSMAWVEEPEQDGAGAGGEDGRPPPRRDARLQRVATSTSSRGGGRAVVRRTRGHRTSSRNRLSSESSRARTSRRRTEASRASRGRARASSPARSGLDDEAVLGRVERDAADGVEADERRSQPAAGVGPHEHVAGPVVHGVADGPVAAGGGQPAVDEDDDPLGQPLDLVEHVRADDHRAALGAEPAEQGDQADPLHGVGAVERLVEHEHLPGRTPAPRRSWCAGACPC